MRTCLTIVASLAVCLTAAARERKPARIVKPVPVPKKLISVVQQVVEDEQFEINRFIGFYKKHIPELIGLLEKQIPENMMDLLEEGDDDDDEMEQRVEQAEWLLEVIKKMIDNFVDYNELAAEEPDHAHRMLNVGKSEYRCICATLKIRALKAAGEAKNKAAIAALEKELRAELDKLFDLKMAAQKEELKWMTKEVHELTRLIARKEKYRKQIIEKKFLELTGELEDLDF